MAVVLDRVPPSAVEVVSHDLRRLMDAEGLAKTSIFTIPETATDADGLLPDDAVAPVRTWLAGLAADTSSRRKVVLQTLDGAVGAIIDKAAIVANAADDQIAAVKDLQGDVESAFSEAGRQVGAQASDGSLLRGEVLARWHEYVGSTALGRLLDEKVSWVRDKLASLIRGRPDGAEVKVAAEEGLRLLIVEAAEQACGRAATAWRAQPSGRALLEGHEDLARASAGLPNAAQRSIQAWQADVLTLVAGEGAGKRQGARIAAAGVNGIGAALMLVIFASTGGITGAEIGVAGGTTVIAQRLLESIFGDEAVRKLAATAKANLVARVDDLLNAEQARYLTILDGLGLAPDASTMVDAAIDQVRAERASGYETPNPPPDPRQSPASADGATS